MNTVVFCIGWGFAAFLMSYGSMTLGGTPAHRRKKLAICTGIVTAIVLFFARTQGGA